MESSTRTPTHIPLRELLELQPGDSPSATISILLRRRGRPHVSLLSPAHHLVSPDPQALQHWFGIPRDLCGDAPGKVTPKFVMAVLSSRAAMKANRQPDQAWPPLPEWLMPQITFDTDDSVRRSMTLNGMRMTTEYFGSGSMRVLKLVKQRLEVGQLDVVHDILVYLVNQIVDVRAEEYEARMLRAEAVAAYLGLDQRRVEALFQQSPVRPQRIAKSIESGSAGTPRRALHIQSLIEGQVQLLQPSLQAAAHAEDVALRMIDRIVALLY